MARSKKVTARSQQQSTKCKASPDDQPQAESTKKAKAKVGELDNKGKDDSSALQCTLPNFKEPDVPWGESKARDLLIQDIIDEVVPREPFPLMPCQVIFTSRPEYAEYGYKDFCNRLSHLHICKPK
jgi:seryl-tRNA synthetase